MANIYKGTEVKFQINLTAPGFSMDEDDFDIEVASPRSSVYGSKGNSDSDDSDYSDVVIFSEGPTDIDYEVVQMVDDEQDLDEGIEYPSYPVYGAVNGEQDLYEFDGSSWTAGPSVSGGMTVVYSEDGHAYEADANGNWNDIGTPRTKTAWFAIVDTSHLNVGDMRVIATAHIVDPNANDGVRDDISVAPLGRLVNP